jgi:hypothetical protein
MIDAEQIRRFCSVLFGGPDGQGDDRLAEFYVTAAWSIPGRETRWRRGNDLAAIVSAITELAEEQDKGGDIKGIYIGPGMTRKNKGRYKRALADDVVVIPGLWADIDVAGGPHEAKAYPPDIESAIAIANAPGIVPTAIIRTGYGIQAYWLFPEPYIIDHDNEKADREILAKAAQDWSSTLRHHAERLGQWKIDSVFDLSRVLRIPGTLNLKVEGDPRLAQIHEMDEARRYELDDLLEYCADETVLASFSGGRGAREPVELEGVNLTQIWARVNSADYRERRYTPEWIESILEIDGPAGMFSLTWENNRVDLRKDSSSYDAAVARILHDYKLTPAHIIEAIMCRRLRHNEKPEKVDPAQRTDYLVRTLGFVQQSAREAARPVGNPRIQARSVDAMVSAASGRLASTVEIEPEPVVEDYDFDGLAEPPEDAEDGYDPFAAYVNDLIGHSTDIPTAGERVAAAISQVDGERGIDSGDREQPAQRVPAGLDDIDDEGLDSRHWCGRSAEMVLRMTDLSDLLFDPVFRERGFEVWTLERQDQGEGAKARVGVRVPQDYDWPQSNRPENYRVGRPLFSEWAKRDIFDTPRGFRNAIMKDCLIPTLPVGDKEEWSALIDMLVPYWLRDSSGGDISDAVHGWLMEYLLDHPSTVDLQEAHDMRKPYLRDHRGWGSDGVPELLLSLDPFLSFVGTRPGGSRGREMRGRVLRYLRAEPTRLRMTDKSGKRSRPTWYEILPEELEDSEWGMVVGVAREAYESREKRGLRSVKDAS